MKKSIKQIAKLVDVVIFEEMIEFNRLGKECKKMQDQGEPEDKLRFMYLEMATIFMNLRPFHYEVRQRYPQHKELFDLLVNLYKDEDKKEFINNP